MSTKPDGYSEPEGPFRASQVREGDPYELSNGHPIKCMSSSDGHAKANVQGALVLATDPAVQGAAGMDVGIEFNEGKNLRAPDLAVGIKGQPGWATDVPPLLVEYADRGQDEKELRNKIEELLAAGTRYIWVVRLVGPLRVEVYEPGKPMRLVDGDGTLTAPGVLQNSYPVRSLADELVARRLTLRNLLQTEGYESLEAVRQEGHKEGQEEGLRQAVRVLCEALDIPLGATRLEQIEQMGIGDMNGLLQQIKTHKRWP